jgi:hypothetical protein
VGWLGVAYACTVKSCGSRSTDCTRSTVMDPTVITAPGHAAAACPAASPALRIAANAGSGISVEDT